MKRQFRFPLPEELNVHACGVLLLIWLLVPCPPPAEAQLSPGQPPPGFILTGLDNKAYDLSQLKDQPLSILFFFDVDSKPSQEGLISLDRLARQYAAAKMQAWGVTRSPKEKLADFTARNQLSIPLLVDNSDVSDRYHARLILPTVCILGPGLKIIDYLQGGGTSAQIMLVRLAERNLQRKQFDVAKQLSKEARKLDPGNAEAGIIAGYAALKEGNLPEAKATFQEMAKAPGKSRIAAQEGLASVYAKEGNFDKALELVQQVEQQAPERGFVHLVKGDILYAKNRKPEAESEFRKATEKSAPSFQKAEALNRYGRLQANAGKLTAARELYDRAVDINPYYIEATSNKGTAYEKEGRWAEALDAYRKALAIDKQDTFSAVLARQAQERLALQQNVERKKRLDNLVKELAERFRTQQKSPPGAEDTWTSRPMVLTFVDIEEKGGLGERDGFAGVLTAHLTEQLNASGRVQVVERALVERLLEELNLGSSELADPNTALRLGRVLAAKLLGTGSLHNLPGGNMVSLRLVDTETSLIAKVFARQISSTHSLEPQFFQLNREILAAIIQTYPLQGYVARMDGSRAMINLGSKQGVVVGTHFEALQEQEPVTYKGKTLQSAPRSVAQLKVVQVEPDLCLAEVINQETPVGPDAKVREKFTPAQ
jgi:tetratricopeptide (TPR) repeat protein